MWQVTCNAVEKTRRRLASDTKTYTVTIDSVVVFRGGGTLATIGEAQTRVFSDWTCQLRCSTPHFLVTLESLLVTKYWTEHSGT